MKHYSILLFLCLVVSTGSLGAAYLFAGYWQIIVFFCLFAILWFGVKKHSVFWAASIYLVGFVLLAAIGIIFDLSLLLMLVSGTTALAGWELMQFAPGNIVTHQHHANATLEKLHLQFLGVAIISGLILSLLVSTFSFALPFGITILLVIILFGGLLFGLHQNK